MFQVLPVTETDLPSMVELWYDAFGDPINRCLYPDTPGARAWLEDYHRATFVKWDFNTTSPGHHFPPRPADFDHAFCDTFFGGLDQARRTIMGTRPHYYLDALITHPDYRRQGAASKLIQWGCDRADQDGIPIWVDSSQEGSQIYRRFGFHDVSVSGVTPTGAMSMLRDPVRGDLPV